MSKQRLAYLVSRYPAISHTFILREVLGLRKLGIEIEVASINSPDRPTETLTADEKAEAARTFFVKAAGSRWAWAGRICAASSTGSCILWKPAWWASGCAKKA